MRVKTGRDLKNMKVNNRNGKKERIRYSNSLSTSQPTNKDLFVHFYLFKFNEGTVLSSTGGITQTKEIRDHL